MPHPNAPLRFPNDFPPTDRWKKFFIGVRWLGPDLSFFKDLKMQQGRREKNQMNVWGGGLHQEIAQIISSILHERHHWGTDVFLPNDQFAVLCQGPKFDMLDEFAMEEAIEAVEKRLNVKIQSAFWAGIEDATFQNVVEKIASLKESA